ncbi:MAG: adenylate kinase [Candidatus Aminicenantes bacterium]|nr:adenylate kinase [Candidatus Aminicenantes bacterium]
MRIILLGAPGSGKGTQGDLISRKYGFPKISSGDLLRKAVNDNTPLGREVEAVMKRGELVRDDVVVGMIKERIEKRDCQQGYILDGFPRTVSQSLTLERMSLEEMEVVFDIHLDDKIVIDRISARRICSGCSHIFNLHLKAADQRALCEDCGGTLVQRDDDKPEIIKDRLKVYHSQNEALVAFYKNKNVYVRLEGDAEIEDIFENIRTLLDEKLVNMFKKR